jgi:hypothetical protein
VQLLYLCTAIVGVVLYAVFLAWDYFALFAISATAYLVGAFYLCWKLAARIHMRWPPAGAAPK